MKEDTLTAEYNNRNRDWDVVATQAMVHDEPTDELEESKMRSQTILMMARNVGKNNIVTKVLNRFIKCINRGD